MSKSQKNRKTNNQPERIEITGARTPKKKTVHADPFARIKLHPLEELEARDALMPEDGVSVLPSSPLASISDPDQVEPRESNQVEPEPSRTKTDQDQVEPRPTNSDQVRASRTKTDQVEPSRTKTKKVETSPSKNFTKVPNSIAKLAIPEKYFRGLSKHTYDILYQQTRGAINPVRTIQLTKGELVKLTGLAVHTVKLHIKYLNESGLIVTHRQIGQHTGSIYEVFVPEEIESVNESDQVEPSSTKTNQNLVRHTGQNLALLGHTKVAENKELNDASKTYFKDFLNIDDEKGIIESLKMLKEAARAATGSDLTQAEVDTLPELFKIIVEEIALARLKTNSVTNYTRFAATHLRRQLNLARQKHVAAQKLFEPGAPQTGGDGAADEAEQIAPLEMEPLNETGRANLLVIYRPLFAEKGIEALENVRGMLTEEDWNWLVENLREN